MQNIQSSIYRLHPRHAMLTLAAAFSFFLTNIVVLVAQNDTGFPFLSNWIEPNYSMPCRTTKAFVVYDNVTNCIYGIGGTTATNIAYIINVTNGNSTTRPVNTSYSNSLIGTVSQNAVLIDNTWMYIATEAGLLLKYNIICNFSTLYFV